MNTSAVEITIISTQGFWLLVHGEEFFLPFSEFPWFADATIRQIHGVVLLSDTHLHWRELGVDLDLDSIRNPEKYPLVAQHTAPAGS